MQSDAQKPAELCHNYFIREGGRIMTGKVFLAGIIFIGLLSFALPIHAGLVKKTIDANTYHHLGDNTIDWMHNPTPEGTSWKKTFTLPVFTASIATIQFTSADINGADIIINGKRLSIPLISAGSSSGFSKIYRPHFITVPAAFFKSGQSNTIRIEALKEPANGNADDFEFLNVILYLQ